MAADLCDVDDLGALADAQVDGLVCAFVQVLKEGHRDLQQGSLRRCPHAQLEQSAREPVPVLCLVEQPVLDQVARHPVNGALRQPGAPDELGQGQDAVLGREGAKDGNRLAEHGVELTGHRFSVPLSGTRRGLVSARSPDAGDMTDAIVHGAAVDAADAATIVAAAARLMSTALTGEPVPPVRDLIGSEDVRAAYAVQQLQTQARLAVGGSVVGRKIGLTSKAVQAQLGVSQPDFGVLFSDMAYVGGAEVPASAVMQPRVEAEIAFVLGDDLVEGDLSYDRVRAAISYAVAALEICGSRVRDWDITFSDTVADNASAGAFVLGPRRMSLAEFEPRETTMTMTIDGTDVTTGKGAACLGDPVRAVLWLAERARDLGDPLRAGQVVLSGALGPMRPIRPGSHVHAVVEPLGAVQFTLGKES